MIGDITVADEIYIVCGYTDMRKSIDGLCAIVEVLSYCTKGCLLHTEDTDGRVIRTKFEALPGASLTGLCQVSI